MSLFRVGRRTFASQRPADFNQPAEFTVCPSLWPAAPNTSHMHGGGDWRVIETFKLLVFIARQSATYMYTHTQCWVIYFEIVDFQATSNSGFDVVELQSSYSVNKVVGYTTSSWFKSSYLHLSYFKGQYHML